MTDTFQGYQTSVNQRLHRLQYSSFPPEGVTGTSSYRNLQIPSQYLDCESIYIGLQDAQSRVYNHNSYTVTANTIWTAYDPQNHTAKLLVIMKNVHHDFLEQ